MSKSGIRSTADGLNKKRIMKYLSVVKGMIRWVILMMKNIKQQQQKAWSTVDTELKEGLSLKECWK